MSQSVHYRISVDMQKVAPGDVETLIGVLKENIATDEQGRPEICQGFRFLFARYNSRVTADARALDAECAVYCGRVEIEEVEA